MQLFQFGSVLTHCLEPRAKYTTPCAERTIHFLGLRQLQISFHPFELKKTNKQKQTRLPDVDDKSMRFEGFQTLSRSDFIIAGFLHLSSKSPNVKRMMALATMLSSRLHAITRCSTECVRHLRSACMEKERAVRKTLT